MTGGGLPAGFRVVLVKPREPGNVGSAARAIANFALGELVLVEPAPRRRYAAETESLLDHPMARAMAAGGLEALERARVVPSLDVALEDCVLTAAFTARSTYRDASRVEAPRDIAHTLLDAVSRGPVALVFGPEDRGLTRAEVERCDHRVTIPTGDGYPVLNLASAVLVMAYELTACTAPAAGSAPGEPPATSGERDRLSHALAAALEALDYPPTRRPPGLARFERLMARAGLTRPEYAFLLGLLQRMGKKKGA